MQAKRLTAASIEKAKSAPPGTERYDLWDTEPRGFGLRVSEFGTKTFTFMCRVKGKQRRITIGRYPAVELSEARAKARELRDKVEAGADPTEAARSLIVRDVVAEYFTKRTQQSTRAKIKTLKASTAAEARRALDRDFVARFGDRAIQTVTRADIREMIDAIVERGAHVHANRALTLVKTFFAWCVAQDYLVTSPAEGIKSVTAETPRERVLSVAELVRVWRAADGLGFPFGPVVKLLILTAQRRDEVGDMGRTELDLDGTVWTIPGRRAKNGREHAVSLSAPALDILRSLPSTRGSFVFTTNDRSGPSGWSKAKVRLDKLLMAPGDEIGPPAPMEHWTFHDLRRSAATCMAELGTPPHIVDRLLNHVSGSIRGVAAIYNRNPYAPERRQALDGWARYLIGAIDGQPDNVVPLRAMA